MTAAPTAITKPKTRSGRILLPWQEAWRRDESPLKIWEKARRVGATYAEANDATMTRLAGRAKRPYWFSSADESAAFEFIDYCDFWRRSADAVADRFTEAVEDPATGKAATAFILRLGANLRITAMSSNPRRFRSKGGDIGLDEFAYHDQPAAMYEAAEPCTTWGGRLRILSTHNGEGSEFARFCEMGRRCAKGEPRPGDIPWSLHRITLPEAVEQGLVERINETQGLALTRGGFLAERRSRCRSEDHWRQEYLAFPSVDSTAWLPYDLLASCEDDGAGLPAGAGDGLRYVGMDIGETEDLTVLWTLERVGDVVWTREVLVFQREPLRVKEEALLARLAHPKVVRACIDATGVGAQIAQAAVRAGKGEAVKFTGPVKEALAAPVRRYFEDRRIRIPPGSEVREDLHAVRMERTAAGNVRFDAARSEAGHADRFWALALALHAAAAATAEPKAWVA